MPAAPAAPPGAPPAGVTIVEGPAPKPPPAPTSTIHVSAMPSSEPLPPPRKGSARAQMRDALRKKAGESADSRSTSPHPGGDARESSSPPSSPAESSTDGGEPSPAASPPGPEGTKPAATPSAADKKGAKPNPWNLYKAEKEARTKVETEFQAYRSTVPRDVDVKGLADRAERAEKIAVSLADEIRYHNYEKSPEFLHYFQTPYENAFRRAMQDFKEVTATDSATGQVRPFSDEDLVQLCFMTLPQAKQVANQVFPDFANDIMEARREVRALWDKRQGALAEWKDKGTQRTQFGMEQLKKQHAQLAGHVQSAWTKANEDLTKHETRGEYFRPHEGDSDWNNRLQKGYELADAAFAANLLDRTMTPDQRAVAVGRYAAVRARAAGWGPLRHENETLKGRVAELQKELESYKETTPPAGGSETNLGAPRGALSAREQMRAELRKRAR